MDIKEKLLSFLKRGQIDTAKKVGEEMTTSLELNSKVDEFIKWYDKNKLFGGYTDIGEYYKAQEMRDLIEKVAVWYELRYPNFEIIELIDNSQKKSSYMNNIIFKNNNGLNKPFKNKFILKDFDWPSFYNFEVFINSLPNDEMCFFVPLEYRSKVNLYFNYHIISFHLSKNGIIEEIDNLEYLPNFPIKAKQLKGMHIDQVVNLLKQNGVELPQNNELDKEINYHNNWQFLRKQLLNCAMYRIIERGGNRIGPRRGLIFAKEFNLNIDIPMMYGVDESDPYLGNFILEYLKAGGSTNLVCLINYFSKTKDFIQYNLITLDSIINLVINDLIKTDIPDNVNLAIKLTNILNSKLEEQKDLKIARTRKL